MARETLVLTELVTQPLVPESVDFDASVNTRTGMAGGVSVFTTGSSLPQPPAHFKI